MFREGLPSGLRTLGDALTFGLSDADLNHMIPREAWGISRTATRRATHATGPPSTV